LGKANVEKVAEYCPDGPVADVLSGFEKYDTST
jgi:hypothetical protein